MARASVVRALSLKAAGLQWAWCGALHQGAGERGGGESQSSTVFPWCSVSDNRGPSLSQSSSWVCTSDGGHLPRCRQQRTDLTEEARKVSGSRVISLHPPHTVSSLCVFLSIQLLCQRVAAGLNLSRGLKIWLGQFTFHVSISTARDHTISTIHQHFTRFPL